MLSAILQSLTRPSELQALVSYKFAPKSENIRIHQDNLAKDESKRRCYDFLNKTSRSFAAVIQELDDQLRDAICLFYLVLRGLDTVEDDMTLPLDRKVEVLRSFDKIIYQRGWTFHECGPDEKDRELLVHFDVVIDEFLRLDDKFQKVIADITRRMGNGMADYAAGEHRENTSVATIADFNLYCHYVAGLVGYGLSDLFSASGLESPQVAENKDLSNNMGLFLQKTNIIRDFREDLEEGRQFWPREIWGQYADEFSDFIKPENKTKARACLNAMVLNVLDLVPDVLTYLNQLRNQSVFNFCAIPQTMAIATLALVFNNMEVFERNIKIRKGEAVKLILASKDMDSVVDIFRHYIRVISQKNEADDPNFMEISIAVGRIEQWIEANTSSKAVTKSSSVAWMPVVVCILAVVGYAFMQQLSQ
ncbi:squalene synthetase [Lichtheimia corymbifera JMRC:FSU:9682]|uniref:Squalene synthase n=1 Tax=Lichtheimia corymbifera JMRC:FSU:9682 TaxID=1263082 RepID=A0A068S4D4_9FUNG|nr:squalene synthetase [Lichtheimia corymbifera JMRC:FSU:9682]